jgi:hypothetical protein
LADRFEITEYRNELQSGCGLWRHVSRQCVQSQRFRTSGRPIAMTRDYRWRWVISTAIAGLVLSATNAVLSTPAQAGCNSPWVHHSGLDASLVELRLLDPGFQSLMAEPWTHQPSDRRGPCTSGSCSRSPELPLGSTIFLALHGEHWGDVSAGPTPGPPQSREFSPDDDQQRASWFPNSVQRPPRIHFAP